MVATRLTYWLSQFCSWHEKFKSGTLDVDALPANTQARADYKYQPNQGVQEGGYVLLRNEPQRRRGRVDCRGMPQGMVQGP